MVPRVGVEPTRCHHHRILNPARLPIPPPRQRGASITNCFKDAKRYLSAMLDSVVSASVSNALVSNERDDDGVIGSSVYRLHSLLMRSIVASD